MKFSKGLKLVFNAPKFFVLNCYDLLQFIHLHILLRLSKARLRKLNMRLRKQDMQISDLTLQCAHSKKMLKPIEHDFLH